MNALRLQWRAAVGNAKRGSATYSVELNKSDFAAIEG
jgi:hypothetical protein